MPINGSYPKEELLLSQGDVYPGLSSGPGPPRPGFHIWCLFWTHCLQSPSTFQSVFQTVDRNNFEKPVCLKICRAPNCLQNKVLPRLGSHVPALLGHAPWSSLCWIPLCPKQCAFSHLTVIISPASPSPCNGLVLPSFSLWQMALLQSPVQISLRSLSFLTQSRIYYSTHLSPSMAPGAQAYYTTYHQLQYFILYSWILFPFN